MESYYAESGIRMNLLMMTPDGKLERVVEASNEVNLIYVFIIIIAILIVWFLARPTPWNIDG